MYLTNYTCRCKHEVITVEDDDDDYIVQYIGNFIVDDDGDEKCQYKVSRRKLIIICKCVFFCNANECLSMSSAYVCPPRGMFTPDDAKSENNRGSEEHISFDYYSC